MVICRADFLNTLKTIELFTLAQRRTKPTVHDFENMLQQNQINLDELEDELKRLPSKAHFISLPPPSPPPPPLPDLTELLGPALSGHNRRSLFLEPLPQYPSSHTYQATPQFAERPTDPRVIREKATAEARLAEVALRKLLAVSAVRKDEDVEADRKVGKKREERHQAWQKAFEDLGQGELGSEEPKTNGVHPEIQSLSSIMDDPVPNDFEKSKGGDECLEVIVNSDSQFWRKRRAPHAKQAHSS
jgi:transcription initiation factor TFIID subunit 8